MLYEDNMDYEADEIEFNSRKLNNFVLAHRVGQQK
jgi:hypothetical protein